MTIKQNTVCQWHLHAAARNFEGGDSEKDAHEDLIYIKLLDVDWHQVTNGTDQDSVSESIPNRQRLSRDFIASNFSSDTRKSYRSLDREDHPILPTRAWSPNRNSKKPPNKEKTFF